MANRIRVHIPVNTSPGEMLAAWMTLLAEFGFEYGEILNTQMTALRGPEWATHIRWQRANNGHPHRFAIHDISFVLGEPVKDDSILRPLFPADRGWVRFFDQVRYRRNDWIHRNCEWTLDELEYSVETLRELVNLVSPQLPIATELNAVLTRIFDLRQAGGVIRDPQIDEMERLLEEANGEIGALQSNVNALMAQVDEAAGEGAEADALREQLAHLEAALRSAEDRYIRARQDAEAAGSSARRSLLPLPPDIAPGDPWPVAKGTRRMHLQKAPAVGLFDVDGGEYVSGELAETARAAAERWLRVMPLGGEIWVDEMWNAAGYVNLELTYLGRLDVEPVQEEVVGAPVIGIFRPRGYLISRAGVIREAPNGAALAEVIGGTAAAAVEQRLDPAVAEAFAASGGSTGDLDVRVTYDGILAAMFGDERGYLGRVEPDRWFPS